MSEGFLTIVGSGIQAGAHLTLASKACIEKADWLVFSVSDPLTAAWLKQLNPKAEPLANPELYEKRGDMYRAMVDHVLGLLGRGGHVCMVIYGHPAVFAEAPLRALKAARAAGYQARMLPGISTEDCLYVDLELDPCENGFQSYEVTDFLIHRRRIDMHCPLLLWQIAVIGESGFYQGETSPERVQVLCDVLLELYPRDHQVVLYEAPIYVVHAPVIEKLPLHSLAQAKIGQRMSLFIPSVGPAPLDREMMAKLGMGRGV